ncbi:MAG: hypothetical protein HYR74_08010 [Candidatus Eisenbacteria bacterium]|nr:hypothetical protein [Candidatus Eisenbacteria bacterium]
MILARPLAAPAAALFAALALASCSKAARPVVPVPAGPTRPALAVAVSRLGDPYYGGVSYEVRWVVTPGGTPAVRVFWRLDPPAPVAVDSTWTRDGTGAHVFVFPWSESHTVAVGAVDTSGAASDVWTRVFPVLAADVSPQVVILHPAAPPDTSYATVSSHVLVQWDGTDIDSPTTQPARYVYRLFAPANPDRPDIADFVEFARTHPESLLALYAPAWSGWTSVPFESTSASLALGTLGSRYLFALNCVDAEGATDVFAAHRNLLPLRVVVVAGVRGARSERSATWRLKRAALPSARPPVTAFRARAGPHL